MSVNEESGVLDGMVKRARSKAVDLVDGQKAETVIRKRAVWLL